MLKNFGRWGNKRLTQPTGLRRARCECEEAACRGPLGPGGRRGGILGLSPSAPWAGPRSERFDPGELKGDIKLAGEKVLELPEIPMSWGRREGQRATAGNSRALSSTPAMSLALHARTVPTSQRLGYALLERKTVPWRCL